MTHRIARWAQRGGLVACLFVVASAWTVAARAGAEELPPLRPAGPIEGWTNWRGPGQNGVSPEKNLPSKWEPNGVNHLWSIPLSARSAPVLAGDRLYVWGYEGKDENLREVLLCLEAGTGKEIWRQEFNDFLSDITYERYSIGAPTIDRETGNIYLQTSPGLFVCVSPEGKRVWEVSLMEQYGRLTFPNGRTGSAVIDDDLVITRCVTANWGAQGAPADRFYAFDKKTGDLVWASTPGISPPKDNSNSTPVFDWWNGMRVFYAGVGCGHVAAVNARTGQALWRFPAGQGGMNASLIRYKDFVIAGHNDENVDTSEMGRMIALRIPKDMDELKAMAAQPDAATGKGAASTQPAMAPTTAPVAAAGTSGGALPIVLDKKAEAWRNPLQVVTSSPVLVGNRLYQLVRQGDLECVNADTGEVLWHHKLAPDQLHASPLYADGKLYVPMHNGMFYILGLRDDGVDELTKVQLVGACLGAPAIWRGRVYVTTTQRLYAFGSKEPTEIAPELKAQPTQFPAITGNPTSLQIIPSDVLVRPGQTVDFRIRSLNAQGLVRPIPSKTAAPITSEDLSWRKFVPPGALVRAEMDATIEQGKLTVGPNAKFSAGMFEGSRGDLKGTLRGRVVPDLPYAFDFENFDLTETHKTDKDASGNAIKFAYPPLPWIGGRFRWEVREDPTTPGNKVLAKTLDNMMMQRAQNFIGRPEMRNYTMQVDVLSEGTRRNMSSVGLVHQRYLIQLLGNWQKIEVTSNADRIKQGVDFKWSPRTWYTLKTRVDTNSDGSGVIRAKAWKRGEAEPENWLLEVPHQHAHQNGAPGIFGFSYQNQFRLFLDNLKVTSNE